jgi:hypothetical protein
MRSIIPRSGHMARWLLTWHEIACRCLWRPCNENVWPCMKFVSYMSFVLSLIMLRSYAHEREFLWKMLHFDHCYVTCLYVSFYLVGDACAQIVAILLVYVSILACCSALCIFEKHKLAFVDLIHALPTRGRKVPNSCFQGEFASRKNWGKCICLGGACIHAFGSIFSPEF